MNATDRPPPEILRLAEAPELGEAFVRLNRAWIERLFVLEPADFEALNHPERIVESGGEVVIARLPDGTVAGTGALLKLDAETAEVVKMAVDDAVQGQGIGRAMLEALVAEAAQRGFRWVRIETSCRLPAANALYRKCGFGPARLQASRHGYARSDVFLERRLHGRPEAAS